MEPKGTKSEPKDAKREPKGAKMETKINQKSIKMAPKTDTSAKVGLGWPKWHQNGSKMQRKGFQNLCKIDAKINAEKMSENEAKINQI